MYIDEREGHVQAGEWSFHVGGVNEKKMLSCGNGTHGFGKMDSATHWGERSNILEWKVKGLTSFFFLGREESRWSGKKIKREKKRKRKKCTIKGRSDGLLKKIWGWSESGNEDFVVDSTISNTWRGLTMIEKRLRVIRKWEGGLSYWFFHFQHVERSDRWHKKDWGWSKSGKEDFTAIASIFSIGRRKGKHEVR